MLPTSAPENRMMAQTMPTMAPAQRVVAPDSSSNRQAFIDSEPPKPPSTEASRLARPLERNSWSRSAGLLPRHLEARHVEQQRDGHHAAERADLGAALGDHAPIDLLADHGVDRPPQGQLAEARQEPRAVHRFVVEEAEQAHIENEEKAEEGDRQGEVVRHPPPEHRDGERRTAPRSEFGVRRAANTAPANWRATA